MSSTSRARLLSFLLAPSLLASAAFAQASPIPFDFNERTDWPAAWGTPPQYQSLVAGDFTGDGLKDAFLLAGGELVLFYAPDSWNSLYPVWDSSCPVYTDIAVVPSAGAVPAYLVAVGPGGLDGIAINGHPAIQTGASTLTSQFKRWSISTATGWQGAVKVEAGCVDSGNVVDFVGVAASGNTVVLHVNSNELSPFTIANSTIMDMLLVQWDDTSSLEIALLDTYGVEIFTQSGARVRRFQRSPSATPNDAFCRYKKAGDGARDRLAWFRADGSGTQELVELSAANLLVKSDPPLTFAPGSFVFSANAADSPTGSAPADGNWDLVAQFGNAEAVFVFKNLGTTGEHPSFSLAEPPDEPWSWGILGGGATISNPSPSMHVAPIYEDLGGDGVPDIFVAVRNTSSSKYHFDAWRGDDPIQAIGDGTNILGVDHGSQDFHTPSAPNTLTFLFQPDVTAPWNANVIEIVGWTRTAEGVYWPGIHGYYLLSSLTPDGANTYTLEVPFDPGATEACLDLQYWFEFRFALLSGSTLTALGTNYIDVIGTDFVGISSLEQVGYSTRTCIADMSVCLVPNVNEAWCAAGSPGTGGIYIRPISMTRRRMPPPPGGMYFPLAEGASQLSPNGS